MQEDKLTRLEFCNELDAKCQYWGKVIAVALKEAGANELVMANSVPILGAIFALSQVLATCGFSNE